MPQLHSLNNMQKKKTTPAGFEPAIFCPKSDALSIRPRGHHCAPTQINFSNQDNER